MSSPYAFNGDLFEHFPSSERFPIKTLGNDSVFLEHVNIFGMIIELADAKK